MKPSITPATWKGYADFAKAKFRFEDFLDDASAAGYMGVEIGGDHQELGAPDSCRRMIESRGLQIAAFNTCVSYTPNTDEYRASLAYAAELGVYTVVVTGGFLPNSRRTTYPFDYDAFCGTLGKVVELAGRQGIEIAFRPHRGSIVETIAEAQEVTRRLPKLKICADFAHLEACGVDVGKFVKTMRRQLVHTHIQDYSWKLDSFVELGRGDGRLNVARCVHELRRIGYDGWLTVEVDKKFAGERPRRPLETAKMCRRYLKRNCGI